MKESRDPGSLNSHESKALTSIREYYHNEILVYEANFTKANIKQTFTILFVAKIYRGCNVSGVGSV